MKHLKSYNENQKKWDEIEESFDAFQLMELLTFKYGREPFKDFIEDIENYDEYYNPNQFYEQIVFALEQSNIYDDFIENWKDYEIKMQENDPFHWRHKQKEIDKLTKGLNWD